MIPFRPLVMSFNSLVLERGEVYKNFCIFPIDDSLFARKMFRYDGQYEVQPWSLTTGSRPMTSVEW